MDIESISSEAFTENSIELEVEIPRSSTAFKVDSYLQPGVSISGETFKELFAKVRSSARIREQAATSLANELSSRGDNLKNDAVSAFNVSQIFYALANYRQAVQWLENAGDGATQLILKGHCLKYLGDYDQAKNAFETAQSKGADTFDMAMLITDSLRCKGDLQAAQEQLQRISRVGEIRAEYHHQLGRLHEADGLHEEAMSEYEQAVQLDSEHTEALFRLAYVTDLYGDEEDAIDYYEKCIASGVAHVSALLNLAVLYEDVEDYESASRCIKQVLAAHPNHPRARMFMKDIDASKVMYYDEEQERRMDHCNQVLEIPISDFELSVRSRNCLRKMNIRCVGDLLRVSESELLAHKNFGETSLQEIRAILNQKSLRLGQLLEDRAGSVASDQDSDEEDQDEENDLLSQSVSELELSVRARKCLQRLNIEIIGDLIKRTEAELLGCKNFGQTSLVEIKQRLKERNLSLRELD